MREVITREVVEVNNNTGKRGWSSPSSIFQEEQGVLDCRSPNLYTDELDHSNVRSTLRLNVGSTICTVLQSVNEQGGNTTMGSVRPDGADLRTKLERPSDELEHLYTTEQKMSRSKNGHVYLALVKVEQYIIYLEKKIARMEKKQ